MDISTKGVSSSYYLIIKHKKMLHAENMSNKALLALLRMNGDFVSAMVEVESFDGIKNLLDNKLQIKYSDSQLEFLKDYFIQKTK